MHRLPHYKPPLPEWYFVTTDEPTKTTHNHIKSVACIMIHTQYCAFYGLEQRYNDIYSLLWYFYRAFTLL